ncbi:MAG: hypothetical protein F6J98_18590, partial [Moorea sp. SIO4G2]|nr:hypothetical protein [Moorena sp. SIO4G2]
GEWHTQSGVEETLISNTFLGEEREDRSEWKDNTANHPPCLPSLIPKV